MPTPWCCGRRMESSTGGWHCLTCRVVLDCELNVIRDATRPAARLTPDPFPAHPGPPGAPTPPLPGTPGVDNA